MKKRIKSLAILLTAALIIPMLGGFTVQAEKQRKKVDVIFTHDTHSHLNSFTTIVDGEKSEVGGFARIKTVIDEKKADNPNTLVLDGGDFSMGTLVQTVYESEAAEIRMLGEIGCDVTTLGNHEFDYRSKGLANMLESAAASGDKLPELVLCNVDWDAMEEKGLSDGQKLIAEGFEDYGIKDYVMLKKGDVNIAVIGVFGTDALACAPTCELLFQDPVEAVKETVKEIQAKEKADMIVCVSHSGTWEDEDKSEDEILAKSVPELDLIVSGHTHTDLDEPIVHGDTYIVSTGEYAKKIGSMSMEQKEDGRWEMKEYELIPITTSIPADETTQAKVDGFMEAVDSEYLSQFGYTQKQVLARNTIEFSSLYDLEYEHTEHNLGNIMSDAYRYAVMNAEDYDGKPVDVAVVPSGTIRDTYAVGDITVESVFNSFSLGIGADGVPGYPLISVYLTGEELKTAAEIDASVSDFMTTARLYMSGLNFNFNPNRMILNKVTDSYLVDMDGNKIELEDDKLYRVVADLYSGQMLSAVTDASHGILSIVPKYEDGTPIEDFEDVIITENGKELKAWEAIAGYMESFEDSDGDGIADVPEEYRKPQGRKVVEDSKDIGDLVKNPNKYTAIIIGAVVAVIVIIVLIVFLIRKLVKRKRIKTAGAGIRPAPFFLCGIQSGK
ncbi:MAG: bifunctional UDP-sugar hydrolase/5'-nucleotidase [Lachnospiraceae bacterium]|nr:bifunctional UDP-sugar hydrolase/5'-nucleotidase [Lachnospiraceae bacterium]